MFRSNQASPTLAIPPERLILSLSKDEAGLPAQKAQPPILQKAQDEGLRENQTSNCPYRPHAGPPALAQEKARSNGAGFSNSDV